MLKITTSSEHLSGRKNEEENQSDYLSEFFEALNVNLILGTNNNMVKKTKGVIYIDKEKALIILSNIIKDLEKKHDFIKSNDFTQVVM